MSKTDKFYLLKLGWSVTSPRSSVDRVLGFEPRGRRFKSCRGYHLNQRLINRGGCANIRWPVRPIL